MARGVLAIADTQEEAERQVLDEAPQMRVLRSREIDMTGLASLLSSPLQKHWVVVVEHRDPQEDAKLAQQEDPETQCERDARLRYLKLGIDPDLLVTGVIERFACPACGGEIEFTLPSPREAGNKTQHRQCPKCRAPLRRPPGRAWEIIPRVRKPPQPCIFCGVIDDSHEHVIPEWISKQVGVKDFLSAEDAFLSPNRRRRKQNISFASYRSRCFCDACNTHFKHLEDAVIPLLVPMARGRSLSLDPESQELLALWADKTAIALLAADDTLRDVVPEEHRRTVRAGQVAESTWVVFFSWHGRPVLGTASGDVTGPGPSTRLRAYMAFLTFGEVGFCVKGFGDQLRQTETIAGELPWLCQVWPRRRELVHWPPGPAVDNRVLPALMGLVPIRSR